jgi:ribosomal protein S18 acetylase RimI-like enzyme
MTEYTIRKATLNDVDFIIEAIIEAEKSGSEKLSYSTVFNLSESELRKIFRLMLLEEIDGCEFSLSSYLIAETENEIVGTIGAWVEDKANPSSFIKSNLLSYFLPNSSMQYARQEAKVTSELIIDHVEGVLTLVIVYVSPAHRGHHIFELLANEHIKKNDGVKELALQVMSNNHNAIRAYERYGFKKFLEIKSENDKIKLFLPHNEKLLMKKSLTKQ